MSEVATIIPTTTTTAVNLLPRAEPLPSSSSSPLMVNNLTLMALLSRPVPLVSPECSPRDIPTDGELDANSKSVLAASPVLTCESSSSVPLIVPALQSQPLQPVVVTPLTPVVVTEDEDRVSTSSSTSFTSSSEIGVPTTAAALPHRPLLPPPKVTRRSSGLPGMRLNKFVRRLYDMLMAEKDSGIVEWRRGLLVLHSTDAFSKQILKKYFNTSSYKTFRRQLNYYGFVHVRSFSTTGSSTTALWVNQDLAKLGNATIESVLTLKRIEPCDSAKTAEARRARKELAVSTVEDDLGVSPKTLQIEQIRSLALRSNNNIGTAATLENANALAASCCGNSSSIAECSTSLLAAVPLMVHCSLQERPSSPERQSCSSVTSDEDEDNSAVANLLLMLSK